MPDIKKPIACCVLFEYQVPDRMIEKIKMATNKALMLET
ncbi:hypothetical protein SAMN05216334_10985 [Nitrosomonas ureae]|uniref:Uncharacterized protein n=1 Tax=Nitrosomonas ureae TaxID=44577 RepID=A0A1H5UV82_9PROT|nr:hypothetical protein SAMN05216334_10985 [Nitrosomonas ureae]